MNHLLFRRPNIINCLSSRLQEVKVQINKMSDSEITGSKLSDWEEYYFQSFEVHPLQIIDDKISLNMEEIKGQQNRSNRLTEEDQDQYNIIKINCKIPIDGDDFLLDYAPSIPINCRFECALIIQSTPPECGYILLDMDFNRQVLEQNEEEMVKIVQDTINKKLAPLRTIIKYVNNDVKDYNNKLRSTIQEALNTRLKRAQSLRNISQKLSIPLKLSENAPNTKPIVLKRIVKPSVSKTSPPEFSHEYSISDEDYKNINNIIYMFGTSMEKIARSLVQHGEEELRDFILATLNTHYENASGETFRKTGKTDIHILFKNLAAFIGECKVWKGEKAFPKAVQQLLSYSTWKDIKVTLVFFNKHNKDFQSILKKIEEWIKANTKSNNHLNKNSWDCIYHQQDTKTDIKLHIVAFDLYVDEIKQ